MSCNCVALKPFQKPNCLHHRNALPCIQIIEVLQNYYMKCKIFWVKTVAGQISGTPQSSLLMGTTHRYLLEVCIVTSKAKCESFYNILATYTVTELSVLVVCSLSAFVLSETLQSWFSLGWNDVLLPVFTLCYIAVSLHVYVATSSKQQELYPEWHTHTGKVPFSGFGWGKLKVLQIIKKLYCYCMHKAVWM